MPEIENNIISALGAGSGIDTRNLVDQLTEIERAPEQQRIDDARELAEAQISDYGLLRSSLDVLQDSAEQLGTESFGAMTASFTGSDAIVPTELGEDAPEGDYTLEVTQIAQAQSLSTTALFDNQTDEVGKGTLTFSFGSWDGTGGADNDVFTLNTDIDSVVVTIDDSNNSLIGLRDAINDADMGVQASIISDDGGYRLLLNAPSGEDNQLMITVDEDGTSDTNVDDSDLSRFAFGETTANQQLQENQDGVDALVVMNGFEFSRSSNVIDDIIEDFTFSLVEAAPGEVVNISITQDKDLAENAVRGFVDAFNAFLETIEPAVGFNEENDDFGSLRQDSTAQSLVRAIRSEISNTIGGLDDGFTTLGSIGIRTELDGTMSIDEDTFTAAFDDNFDLVQALFAPQTSSSSDRIVVNSFGDNTVPGSYEVSITTEPSTGYLTGATVTADILTDLAVAATAGSYTGAASAFSGTDLSTQGRVSGDYDFEITVDGGTAVTISLPIADYADEDAIATALQAEFDSSSVEADITYSGTAFEIVSRSSGSDSSIAITDTGNYPSELALSTGSATAGTGPNEDDYDFTISVDGNTSGTISLTLGTYASYDELAAHIQSQINNDSTLQETGSDVDVEWDTDHFVVTSRQYGDSSTVSVTAVGASAGDLMLDTGSSTSGTDVAGTFDNVTGFGVGNALLPELDSDPYGLTLIVREGATDSTINFSRGFAGELSALIDSYLESSGIFSVREDSLNSRLDDLDEDQQDLDRRIDGFTERLIAQYTAMESIINSLNSSGSFLDGILDRLPFTAGNN